MSTFKMNDLFAKHFRGVVSIISDGLNTPQFRKAAEWNLIAMAVTGVFASVIPLVATGFDAKNAITTLLDLQALKFIAFVTFGMLMSGGITLLVSRYYRKNGDLLRAKRVLIVTYISALNQTTLNPQLRRKRR